MDEINRIWNREDHVDLHISTMPLYMCVTLEDVICSANLGSSSLCLYTPYLFQNQSGE